MPYASAVPHCPDLHRSNGAIPAPGSVTFLCTVAPRPQPAGFPHTSTPRPGQCPAAALNQGSALAELVSAPQSARSRHVGAALLLLVETSQLRGRDGGRPRFTHQHPSSRSHLPPQPVMSFSSPWMTQVAQAASRNFGESTSPAAPLCPTAPAALSRDQQCPEEPRSPPRCSPGASGRIFPALVSQLGT